MDNNQNEILRKAVRGFCATKEWPHVFAVSLTMTPKLSDPSRQLTEEVASKNFREFLNLVNYRIYAKSYQCIGKCLEVIPVLEFAPESERFFYHCLIEGPVDMDGMTFSDILRNNWYRTEWSRPEMDITLSEMENPEEFLKYIAKHADPGHGMDLGEHETFSN